MHLQTPLNQRITPPKRSFQILQHMSVKHVMTLCAVGIMTCMVTGVLFDAAPTYVYADPQDSPDISWDPAVPSVSDEGHSSTAPASGVDGVSSSQAASGHESHTDSSGDISTTGTTNPGLSPAAEGAAGMPQGGAEASSSSAPHSASGDAPESSSTSNSADRSVAPSESTADEMVWGDVTALVTARGDSLPSLVYVIAGIISVLLLLLIGAFALWWSKRSRGTYPAPHAPQPSKKNSSEILLPLEDQKDLGVHRPAHFAPQDARTMKSEIMRDMGMNVDLGRVSHASRNVLESLDVCEIGITNDMSRAALTHGAAAHIDRLVGVSQTVTDLPKRPEIQVSTSLTGAHVATSEISENGEAGIDDTDAYLARCGIVLHHPYRAQAHETFVTREAFEYDPPFDAYPSAWSPRQIASIEQMEADAYRDQEIKEQVEHTYHEVAAEISELARKHAHASCVDSGRHQSQEVEMIPEDTSAQNSVELDMKIADQAAHFAERPKGFDLQKMFSAEYVEPVHQAESPISRVAQLAIVPETEVPSVEAPSRDAARRRSSLVIGNTDMFLRAALKPKQGAYEQMSEGVQKAAPVSAVSGKQSATLLPDSQRSVRGVWSAPSGITRPSVESHDKRRYSTDFDYVSAPNSDVVDQSSLLFFGTVSHDGQRRASRARVTDVLHQGVLPGDTVIDRFRFYLAQNS